MQKLAVLPSVLVVALAPLLGAGQEPPAPEPVGIRLAFFSPVSEDKTGVVGSFAQRTLLYAEANHPELRMHGYKPYSTTFDMLITTIDFSGMTELEDFFAETSSEEGWKALEPVARSRRS